MTYSDRSPPHLVYFAPYYVKRHVSSMASLLSVQSYRLFLKKTPNILLIDYIGIKRHCSYIPAFSGEVNSSDDFRKVKRRVQILHLNCSGSDGKSWTGIASQLFFKSYKEIHPSHIIQEVNLWEKELLQFNLAHVASKMRMAAGQEMQGDKENLAVLENMIKTLFSADKLVISSPMWNFSVPYVLKQYIDCIVQSGLTFQETKMGSRGLVTGRPLLLITSSGEDYSTEDMAKRDFQVPYLKVIFGFIGFTDVRHIYVKNTAHETRRYLLDYIDKAVKDEVKRF